MENPSHCVKFWWRNILNINNFWPESEMCAAWSWYLANDFQFFCLSPAFLILIGTFAPLAWVLLVSTIIASWISIVWMIDHHPIGTTDFDVLYDKPWTRIPPYLIGLATGVLIVKLDTVPGVKTLRTCLYALLGWLTASALALSVVYGVYHAHITGPDLASPLGKLNTSLSRSAWSLSLAWVTLACVMGWGGPVDWILSLPPLRFTRSSIWVIDKPESKVPSLI